MASSSFSGSGPVKYDVFLSFRGTDTRRNFTSHLYAALNRNGISTFIDGQLQRGDEISLTLLDAIDSSSISIVVFSENFASSGWCLEEVAKIVECKKKRGQTILPVFYHVEPSDVRGQKGSFGEAFARLEKRYHENHDHVKTWRDALRHVANLSGFSINQHEGTEASSIDEITQNVVKKLKFKLSIDPLDDYVGISSPVARVKSLLCIGVPDIRVVGIWGMGGIGKTTIAEVVFQQIADRFEGHSFPRNVKEVGRSLPVKIVYDILQDPNPMETNLPLHRLCCKRSLIVLDDVDESDQVKYLVKHLGPGSRIILISRDIHVLKECGAELYEHKKLDYCEAVQLFSVHAFKQNQPPRDYMQLSNQVIHYADGNPLCLKVLGNCLFDRTELQWKDLLEKLKQTSNSKIQDVLKISYDGLDTEEKSIFLDIVCFFIGWDKDRVITIMKSSGLSAEIGMGSLVDKGLVTIRDNGLFVPELIQEMGRHIVLQESREDPSGCSRLWNPQ